MYKYDHVNIITYMNNFHIKKSKLFLFTLKMTVNFQFLSSTIKPIEIYRTIHNIININADLLIQKNLN